MHASFGVFSLGVHKEKYFCMVKQCMENTKKYRQIQSINDKQIQNNWQKQIGRNIWVLKNMSPDIWFLELK